MGELLAVLRERGVEPTLHDGRLRCKAPPGVLTEELSGLIRTHKADLIALLEDVSHSSASFAPIPHIEVQDSAPLSPTQQRLALTRRSGGLLPTAFSLRGPLDVAALQKTLANIVDRHGILRTTFHLTETPMRQRVHPSMPVLVPLTDLSELPEAEREAKVQEQVDALRGTHLSIETGPPFCFHLFRFSDSNHVLFAGFSALIFDGWCFDLFWSNLTEGYTRQLRGEPPAPAASSVTYADVIAWQAHQFEEKKNQLERFWKEHLGDELPPPPLPTCHPRQRTNRESSGRVKLDLSPTVTNALRKFAAAQGLTPQMAMLAALFAWVDRVGEGRDVVIATPVDARAHPDTATVLGPLANLLLLRTEVNGALTFTQHAQAIRNLCLSAYDRQEFPVDRLPVRPSRARTGGLLPAVQLEFSYQQVQERDHHLGNVALSQLELPSGALSNELTFWVKDWGERIDGAFEFRADLYDEATIRHWANSYHHFLLELMTHAETSMTNLDLLGSERSTVEEAWRRAARNLPAEWLDGEELSGEVSLRILDDHEQPCALSQRGVIEVTRDGVVSRLSHRAAVNHRGEFVEAADHEAAALDEPSRSLDDGEGPRTELEHSLVQLFQELLELPRVPVDASYFDLGGSSLTLVRLFSELQQRYGLSLPLSTILEAGTPRALAAVIEKRAFQRQGCLVPLKAGSGEQNLFLIHDADGETLLYLNLARRMPEHVGVYGVEPLRDGELPIVHATIEDIAAHYVREIRAVQPRGPYFLGGLCAGGVLAFEAASQLRAMGHEVPFLALLEAAPPAARIKKSLASKRLERFVRSVAQPDPLRAFERVRILSNKVSNLLHYELSRWRKSARAQLLYHTLAHAYPRWGEWPDFLPYPSPRDVYNLAAQRYAPTRCDVDGAILFRALDGSGADQAFRELLAEPLFGWENLFPTPPRAVDVSGGHAEMMRVPYVDQLVPHFLQAFGVGESASPAKRDPLGAAARGDHHDPVAADR